VKAKVSELLKHAKGIYIDLHGNCCCGANHVCNKCKESVQQIAKIRHKQISKQTKLGRKSKGTENETFRSLRNKKQKMQYETRNQYVGDQRFLPRGGPVTAETTVPPTTPPPNVINNIVNADQQVLREELADLRQLIGTLRNNNNDVAENYEGNERPAPPTVLPIIPEVEAIPIAEVESPVLAEQIREEGLNNMLLQQIQQVLENIQQQQQQQQQVPVAAIAQVPPEYPPIRVIVEVVNQAGVPPAAAVPVNRNVNVNPNEEIPAVAPIPVIPPRQQQQQQQQQQQPPSAAPQVPVQQQEQQPSAAPQVPVQQQEQQPVPPSIPQVPVQQSTPPVAEEAPSIPPPPVLPDANSGYVYAPIPTNEPTITEVAMVPVAVPVVEPIAEIDQDEERRHRNRLALNQQRRQIYQRINEGNRRRVQEEYRLWETNEYQSELDKQRHLQIIKNRDKEFALQHQQLLKKEAAEFERDTTRTYQQTNIFRHQIRKLEEQRDDLQTELITRKAQSDALKVQETKAKETQDMSLLIETKALKRKIDESISPMNKKVAELDQTVNNILKESNDARERSERLGMSKEDIFKRKERSLTISKVMPTAKKQQIQNDVPEMVTNIPEIAEPETQIVSSTAIPQPQLVNSKKRKAPFMEPTPQNISFNEETPLGALNRAAILPVDNNNQQLIPVANNMPEARTTNKRTRGGPTTADLERMSLEELQVAYPELFQSTVNDVYDVIEAEAVNEALPLVLNPGLDTRTGRDTRGVFANAWNAVRRENSEHLAALLAIVGKDIQKRRSSLNQILQTYVAVPPNSDGLDLQRRLEQGLMTLTPSQLQTLLQTVTEEWERRR
jgi:hypothetical protein